MFHNEQNSNNDILHITKLDIFVFYPVKEILTQNNINMNAYKGHILNSLTFLIMGSWGYFVTQAPSALAPILIGVVLLSLSQGVKSENKAMAHVAVIITILGLIGIAMKPLVGALSSDDIMKKIRVFSMVITSVIAIIFFVKSFIDAGKARRAREAANK